jgi:small-conductance mechanosensitive channel
MPRSLKRQVFALLLALVLLGGGSSVDGARRAPAPRAAPGSLFERQPLGFDGTTVQRIAAGVRSLPQRLPELAREQGAALGGIGAISLLFLIVVLAYGLVGQKQLANRLERAFEPSRASRAGPALGAAAHVFAAALLPVALWGLHALVADLSGSDDPVFSFVGTLLVAWAWFAIAVALLRELLMRPLLPVPPEHGRYLYRAGRWLLAYGVCGALVLQAAWTFELPGDVIALAYAVFELSLIALLGVYLARRRSVMALFPEVPNRLYRRFVTALDRVYFVALGVTLLTALLAWAGYVRLAQFVWIRTWAIAALFLFAVFVHHALRVGVRKWIPAHAEPRESAESFHRSATRLLDYVVVIAVVLLVLDVSGLRAPLTGLLATPLSTVDEHPLSILTLVQGVAIVAAFIFAAGLLRDYLEYRVYPALNLDEGVAHAIDTSLVYSVSIIGVLAALQAVGLGIGSITVFAGALGIGVGFGLQSLAGNLASGLVLIFSRALRKGDWVKVGDTVGVIQEVGVRATRLRSRDAVEFLVPNADFVGGTIVNWTHTSPFVRIHVPVGVAYQADPDRVREILERVAAETPRVERSPAPEVWLVKFAGDTVDFELLVWIHMKQVSEHQVRSDLYFAIFRAFAAAGIEFSSPKDIALRN